MAEALFLEIRKLSGDVIARFMLPATCFIEIRPMPALWQASRARFMSSSLCNPRVVLEHDCVDEPTLDRGLQDFGPLRVMGGEADELRLARLANRFGRFFEFLALRPFDLGVEVAGRPWRG